MNLRVALGWSTLLHVGILAIRPPAGFVPSAKTLHPLEVTVLPVRSIQVPTPSARKSSSRPDPKSESEQSRSWPEEKEPPRRIPADRPSPPPPPTRPTPPAPSSPRPGPAVAPAPRPAASASGLPERAFAAIQHKEQVREHLRARMRYPFPRVEGRLRLQISLDSGGKLQQASVLDATDPRLAAAALEDARAAAPYPRFPSTLREPRARYEFLVRYEPE